MQQKYHSSKTDNMENLLIKFPKSMMEKINKEVETKAYGSKAEFIRESVRRMLRNE